MLDKVRKPKKAKSVSRIIGWTLLGLICLSFVFVGLTPSNVSNFQGGPNAAVVNSEVINLAQFEQAMERSRRQMGDMFNQLPAAQRRFFENNLRQRVLNELINTQLIYKEAANTGFEPSAQAIREELIQLPYFQEDGRFSRERYVSLLEANRMTPAAFEDQIRQQLTLQQTSRIFSSALREPKFLKELESEARGMQADIRYIAFDSGSLLESVNVDDAQISTYLNDQNNLNRVQTYYNAYPNEFKQAASVKARHILIKSEEGEAAAKAKIDEIHKQVNASNFSALAKQHSQDVGSADKGGDLGYFEKGRMVQAFEEKAFAMNKGEISEPVKTEFGYHIILVDDKKSDNVISFDEAKSGIAQKQIAEELTNNALKDIEAALQSKDQLDVVLKRYGITWQSTGSFSLAAPETPISEDLVIAALEAKSTEAIVPKLIKIDGKNYILSPARLTRRGSSVSDEENALGNRGIAAMEAWAGSLRESAKIQLNSQLMKQ